MFDDDDVKVIANNPSIIKHLDIYQSIIKRIADSSTKCKLWCIVLLSVILLFSITKRIPALIHLSYIPLFLFYFLDSYYLALESDFRKSYNRLVNNINNKNLDAIRIYDITLNTNYFHRVGLTIFHAVKSPATLPFYGSLFLLILVAKSYFVS
ncbi:MAG: hypothetical protein P9L92_00970 [Candidatus Electryonea clarkiae]|nr:hypothetical protein [Candidatus Electryonea clarkiae]